MCWWNHLDKTKGSRPRCVLLMDGQEEDVAQRLNQLVNLPDVVVSSDDIWMPSGKPSRSAEGIWDITPAKEAKLDNPNELLPPQIQQELKNWWLTVPRNANTPNWDIASTCKIKGEKGLLLVEAKAHGKELSEAGKNRPTTLNGWENHKQIGRAIADAAADLQFTTGTSWSILRDRHYQLSNRFAWSWKIVSLGIPVVLVYLGFLNANDMANDGTLFTSDGDWSNAVEKHCKGIINKTIWNTTLDFEGVSFIPLTRVYDQHFEPNDIDIET